jgi:putative transposase
VKRAEEWIYGSLAERVFNIRTMLDETYIELDNRWKDEVNMTIPQKELNKIRNSVNRQAPLGEESWQLETAIKYGLLSTLNERGRPKKDRH